MRAFVVAVPLLLACTPSGPRAKRPVANGEGVSVEAVIARERWRLKECFNAALTADPNAGGVYKLRFEIGETGAVTRIVMVSSEGTRSLGDCVARSFLSVQFSPPPGGHAEFVIPVVLSASAKVEPRLGPMSCSVIDTYEACDTVAIDDHALALLEQKKPESVVVAFRSQATNSDVATILRWPKVRRLIVLRSPIDDISSVSKLIDLEFLGLVDTKVANLSALASLPKLRFLNLSGLPVPDLSPLAKLTTLEGVVLSRTAVHDLWPLLGSAKSLKRLVVPKTVPESSLSTFRALNPALMIETN